MQEVKRSSNVIWDAGDEKEKQPISHVGRRNKVPSVPPTYPKRCASLTYAVANTKSPTTDLDEQKEREAIKKINEKYDTITQHKNFSGNAHNSVSGTKNSSPFTNDVNDSVKRDSVHTTVSGVSVHGSMSVNVSNVSEPNIDDRHNDDSFFPPPPVMEDFGYKSGGLSDTASDISNITASSLSSASSGVKTNVSSSSALTDHEIAQVELFYQGHKTDVHVCRCMANLYFGKVVQKLVKDPDWKLYATGIPVLVLDSGQHFRARRLYFVMAERGTGFVLWKDILDNLSKYSSPQNNFQTLQVSTDHTKLAGLSFDETGAAGEFYRAYCQITSNPDDELLKLSTQSSRPGKREKRKSRSKSISKAEISQPCCFVHMTTVQRPATNTVTNAIENDMPKSATQTGNSIAVDKTAIVETSNRPKFNGER